VTGLIVLATALLADTIDRQRVQQGVLRLADLQKLVDEARAYQAQHFGDCPIEGSCAAAAFSLMIVARQAGIPLVLQAGSAYWRRMTDEQDDGVSPLQFGYEWEPNSTMTRFMIAQGRMPEMHVWVGNPETQEIVDINAGLFPVQAQKLIGVDWPGPRPPDVLWTRASQLPENAWYRPDGEATKLAMEMLISDFRH